MVMLLTIFLLLAYEQAAVFFKSIENTQILSTKNDALKKTASNIKRNASILFKTYNTMEDTAKSLCSSSENVQDKTDTIVGHNDRIKRLTSKCNRQDCRKYWPGGFRYKTGSSRIIRNRS